MNHAIMTADRNTHLKVAALALVAAIVVIVIGFNARIDDSGNLMASAANQGPAVKASPVLHFSTRDGPEVR